MLNEQHTMLNFQVRKELRLEGLYRIIEEDKYQFSQNPGPQTAFHLLVLFNLLTLISKNFSLTPPWLRGSCLTPDSCLGLVFE
jgi:hypothetical protein